MNVATGAEDCIAGGIAFYPSPSLGATNVALNWIASRYGLVVVPFLMSVNRRSNGQVACGRNIEVAVFVIPLGAWLLAPLPPLRNPLSCPGRVRKPRFDSLEGSRWKMSSSWLLGGPVRSNHRIGALRVFSYWYANA